MAIEGSTNVTLVVPVLNEAASLPRLLASIHSQLFRPSEIIFVDAGSTDDTQTIIKTAAQNDARIRLLVEPGATPGRGRNVGIAAAKHDWIALTDAGIELAPEWLAALVAAVRGRPYAGVAYGNFNPRMDSLFAEYLSLAYVPPLRTIDGVRSRGRCIASCLLRRDVWETVGGFPDLRAGEDRIFMERLEEARVGAVWAPGASMTWDLPETLGRVFRRFESYSMHNVIAGRQRDWHYGVAKIYLAGAIVLLAACHVHVLFWGLFFAFGVARAVKSIITRRGDHGILWCFRPDRVVSVLLLLLWIDVATFVGWAHAAARKGSRARSGLATDGSL